MAARGIIGRWEQHLRRRGRAPATIKAYTRAAATFTRALPRWRTATTGDLEAWLDARPLATPGARRWWVAVLRGFYRWASDEGLCESDRAATRLVLPRRVTHPVRPVAPADVEMALDLARGPCQVAVALMVYAGLRCCEVARLRWIDTDIPAGALYIEGKGGRTRFVPLHPILRDVLGPMGRPMSPTIGAPWTARQVSDRVGGFLRGIGVNATAHQLRKSFATAAYDATRDIRATADLLGHIDTATTAAYVGIGRDRLAQVVAAVTYRSSSSRS